MRMIVFAAFGIIAIGTALPAMADETPSPASLPDRMAAARSVSTYLKWSVKAASVCERTDDVPAALKAHAKPFLAAPDAYGGDPEELVDEAAAVWSGFPPSCRLKALDG